MTTSSDCGAALQLSYPTVRLFDMSLVMALSVSPFSNKVLLKNPNRADEGNQGGMKVGREKLRGKI